MKENNKIHSFLPIINSECKILILGSMPGVESLRKSEYYGHPRNAFWRIIFDLLGYEYTDDYEEKKQMLLQNHIALWDVISSCERQGSLDSKIKEDVSNDFAQLFINYPNIRHVYFNGQKAYDTYKKKVGFDDVRTFVKLPSTSPAHAMKFEVKFADWMKIFSTY